MTYTITLPDGQQVGTGQGLPALGAVKHTAAAFGTSEADPGGVCAAELELELLGAVTLSPGDPLLLHRDGTLLGTFYAQEPTAMGQGRWRVLAYDAVSKLDRELTDWLEGLTGWPYSLWDFAQMVCAACGLTLQGSLENPTLPVPAFQARGITGRQLMQWVCQGGCRFCRATAEGSLELAWVRESTLILRPTGEDFYFQGMDRGSYTVPRPTCVQLALTDSDVGVCSSDSREQVLSIRGNYLLCAATPVEAKAIESALCPPYTPCRLQTLTPIAPGTLFQVEQGGTLYPVLAMTVQEQGGRFTVGCTGSESRSGSSALCRGEYKALSGRIMELRLDLQGLRTRLRQQEQEQERYSLLHQQVDSLLAEVGALEQQAQEQYARLELRSDGMTLSVRQLAERVEQKAEQTVVQPLTEHFRFDEGGLTISDTATGMWVQVSEEAVRFQEGTRITPTCLQTTDLQVAGHLALGDFTLLPRSGGNLSLRYTGQT